MNREQLREEIAMGRIQEDTSVVTLDWVLLWQIPDWMVPDFDCPGHGPHDWFPRVTTRGNHYVWCRNCNRRKVEADDTRPALEVIASWR